MSILRVLAGLACAAIGSLPPYVLYAMSEQKGFSDWGRLIALLVAAATAFIVWVVCRLTMGSGVTHALVGVPACYGSFALLLLPGSLKHPESLIWWPIAALFAIPFMAPLVATGWLGAMIAVPAPNKQIPSSN